MPHLNNSFESGIAYNGKEMFTDEIGHRLQKYKCYYKEEAN